jgi:PLP dependent protein
MGIAENISRLRKEIPEQVTLVAVSKTMPVELIREAYESGQRVFGENRVQELIEKHKVLPQDIEWHLIGHLQTNKVRYITPFISLIHSVDSLKLLSEINREALRANRRINCLLQLRIAREESKFGLQFPDALQILESGEYKDFQHIRLTGVMGMATYTSDERQIREEFLQLARYFQEIKARYFAGIDSFRELSMGMSGDYELALKAGSTIVRIGTLIFGERNYNEEN